jgi:hypothetical protein
MFVFGPPVFRVRRDKLRGSFSSFLNFSILEISETGCRLLARLSSDNDLPSGGPASWGSVTIWPFEVSIFDSPKEKGQALGATALDNVLPPLWQRRTQLLAYAHGVYFSS